MPRYGNKTKINYVSLKSSFMGLAAFGVDVQGY